MNRLFPVDGDDELPADDVTLDEEPDTEEPDTEEPEAAAPTAPATTAASPIPPADPEVRIVWSARRAKTVGARMRGDVLEVSVPKWMSGHEAGLWAERFEEKFRRKRETSRLDLEAVARRLADRYDLPRPHTIVWASMRTRWGSCTYGTKRIRISDALAPFPDWVVEYVIVHELAHLVRPDHSRAFWQLVARYPLAERARGYLLAKGGDETY